LPTSSELMPATVDDLAVVLGHHPSDGGAGTKSWWAMPSTAAEPDVVLETAGLTRIVEHAAGDLVVTAEAGVPLAALQDHVAAAGQWLALDPPEAGATVGGVVAAAASGPRRLRYGTPRDLLIGVTVVLADGTIARSGGKVVKNVAGYDLGKLFTGSFGTLGVIAQCTFRLHPKPRVRRVVTAGLDDPVEAARRLGPTGAVPTAVEWDGTSLVVLIESIEAGADAQAAAVSSAIGGTVGDTLPAGFGEHPWSAGGVGLKLTHRLGALRETLAAITTEVPGARIRAHVGSGVVWVGTDADDLPGITAVESLRAAVSGYDGQVVVVQAPAGATRGLDVWGPVRGLEIMRRLKERFDPDARMAPGRFVGGI
jgi:glycolate oxidase FAD binding subunit